MREIIFDRNRCDGCGDCEVACVVEHSATRDASVALDEISARQTRIRIQPYKAQYHAVMCVHCEDAPCVAACPNGAMARDEQTGSVVVDEARCQGCFMCAMTCAFGAIAMDPVSGLSLKCDRCVDRLHDGRDPACVEACPRGAFEFRDLDDFVRGRMRGTAETLGEASRMFGGDR